MNAVQTNIQSYSARMRRLVTVLWLLATALVVGERFSAAAIGAFRSGFAAIPTRWLACQAVAAIPEALFLLALWWVRDALASFARGELFAPPLTRMFERVGIALVCGAAARIALVPAACRFLGFNPGYWIAFDAAAIALAAIGLALKAIAGVLRHAAAIQSELDEIF